MNGRLLGARSPCLSAVVQRTNKYLRQPSRLLPQFPQSFPSPLRRRPTTTAMRPDPPPTTTTLHALKGHKDDQSRKGTWPTQEPLLYKFPSEATLPRVYEVTQRWVWMAIFKDTLS